MNNYTKTRGQNQAMQKEKYRVVYTPGGAAREYSELAVNTAIGCEHGCKYCYVPPFRRTSREAFRDNVCPRKGFMQKLILDLKEMSLLQDKRRVLFCFMTDPYQPKLAASMRGYLKNFRAYDIAFQVLTKNGKNAIKDFDLYSKKDAFAETIVFSDQETQSKFEPYAGTLEERLQALKKAKEKGIETWVSLEPVIIPEQALKVIDMTKEYSDRYKVGKVNGFKLDQQPDWKKFTSDVINKLEKEGKDYYIKKSLRPYM